MTMITVEQINLNVLSITAELTGLYHAWVTTESVISVLLDRYHVTNFGMLGVGMLTDIPALKLIQDINAKINLYLDVYVATRSRHEVGCDFMCYKDCEDGVLSMLKSFSVIPMKQLLSSDPVVDNNEIDLDNQGQQPVSKKRKIEILDQMSDYGLGLLQMHPYVISIFGVLQTNGSGLLSRADVLRILLNFHNHGGEISDYKNEAFFNAEEFRKFVFDTYKFSLEEAGVRLVIQQPQNTVHLGHETTLMFRHVQSWHDSHMKEWKRKELDAIQKEEIFIAESRFKEKVAPVLVLPQNDSSTQFFQKCIQDINDLVGPYSPSFSKALSVVKRVLNPSSGASSSDVNSMTPLLPLTTTEKVESVDVPHLLTEYLMLHIGSSKYRQKRFSYVEHGVGNTHGSEHKSSSQCHTTSPDAKLQTISRTASKFVEDSRQHNTDSSIGMHEESEIFLKPLRPSAARVCEFVDSVQLASLCCRAPWAAAQQGSQQLHPDMQEIGRWGEALVYQLLLLRHPKASITWLNKDRETQAYYDIKLEEKVSGSNHVVTTFIEVKTTRFESLNVFDISPNEWAFASGNPPVHYDVYRVYNAGDPENVRVQIVRNLLNSIVEHRVRLCLAI